MRVARPRLSSLREAFVVGDVVGWGLRASATMGRLRTAALTLADLDLSHDELLTHLDDQVQRLAAETGRADADDFGATCLYAVYDPVTRRCILASASHPPPAVVWPDGSAEFIDVTPGPPLGGSMPFEVSEVELPPGSVLALYTDGLVEGADRDMGHGMALFRERVADAVRGGTALRDAVAQLIVDAPGAPQAADDDTAVLLARVRATPAHHVAAWEFPAEPAAVSTARQVATRQLTAWGSTTWTSPPNSWSASS